jgi:predicted transcriptional regulator
MQAIMISIKPEWVAKILNGEKTIEIRKTMPKCDLPIDVYIYCTKNGGYLHLENDNTWSYSRNQKYTYVRTGKVVAKFTLNKVEEIKYHFGYYDMGEWTESYILENSCLTAEELDNYLQASKEYDEKKVSRVYGYAWHIDNLVIFDRPKEISEFKHIKRVIGCENGYGFDRKELRSLTRAPQSWIYIEMEN